MSNSDLRLVQLDETIEHTRTRIYAYLRALQPIDGVCFCSNESYHRGRELIAVLAESSEGCDRPRRRLTSNECADVIAFMSRSEPRTRATFFKDVSGQPSIECGLHSVLDAIESSLRRAN